MHVLLDVVTEPNVLAHLITRPVNTPFLGVAEPITVRTPRLESLLADKLTAFAPGSVGVSLTAQFSQQVIKQLFDIVQLYDHAKDLTDTPADITGLRALDGQDSQINGHRMGLQAGRARADGGFFQVRAVARDGNPERLPSDHPGCSC
jgi:Nucleotidyl transferase AbiEii toxin, Type IV TA system